MKKFLYLLPVLALGLLSCHSDDDLPEVKMNVTMSGGVQGDDGVIYVVDGETLTVESVSAEPLNGKTTSVGATSYFIDGVPAGTSVVAPYRMSFSTVGWELGRVYLLQIRSGIFQVDKTPGFTLLTYKVATVAGTDDLPDDGGTSGSPEPESVVMTEQ